MKKMLVSVSLLGLLLTVLPGCGSKVSKGNYDQVKEGMTEAQVEAILGQGEEQASSDLSVPGMSVGGISVPGMSASSKVVVWKDGAKIISVSFMNGKVVGKAQTGL